MTVRRNFIAIIAFTALIILAFVFLLDPQMSGKKVGRQALVLLIIGLVAARSDLWKRPSWWVVVLAVAALVSAPFVALSRAFGSIDVMSLIFHIEFGTEGATLKGFEQDIREGFIPAALITFSIYAIWSLTRFGRWIFVAGAAALLIINPMSIHMLDYLSRPQVESDLHERLAAPVVAEPETRPDVLLIYLEGLERTFNRSDLFGDVYAQMNAYEAEGLTFSNVMQVEGTGWTLAGLTATKCGVPPLSNGLRFHNKFHEQTDFLTSKTCLPDVLADAGYRNKFILGSDQTFSGKNNLLASHSFDHVLDRFEMETMYPPSEVEAALSDWVLDDEMLFETARRVYDDMIVDPSPIFMVIETFGPHGGSAILSRNCTPDGQATIWENVPDTVACTLSDMDPFIDHVRNARQDRPTLVFLLSDHLNHGTEISREMPEGERRNSAVMFGLGFDSPYLMPGTVNDRPASLMDLYPTMLSVIGFAGPDAKAGLGVSLFAEQETLVEEKGFDRFNLELFPNGPLAAAIWN